MLRIPPRGHVLSEHDAEHDHPAAEREVQDVVCPVHGHEVRAAFVGAEECAVEEQGEVDDAAADQERARAFERLRQHEPGGAEEQMDDVVQDAHVEDPEQLGIGVVPGELQVVVVRRDPRDEPEDADEQEHQADEHRDGLDR